MTPSVRASRRAAREVAPKMRDAGVHEVALWGAGRHTARVLDALKLMESIGATPMTPLTPSTPRITRVVDDHAQGRVGEFAIERPESLCAGQAVLISSDARGGDVGVVDAAARSVACACSGCTPTERHAVVTRASCRRRGDRRDGCIRWRRDFARAIDPRGGPN